VTTFQRERWATFVKDAMPIFPLHYMELALDQDKVRLCLDFSRYEAADREGQLHLVTMREDGKLAGYWIGAVMLHLHYADAGPMAIVDIYFVLPEYRVGGNGAKLLLEVERTLKERGVVKIYQSCKVHSDQSGLFKALGYKPTDYVFTKFIGDK